MSDSSDAHPRLISLLTLHALVHGLAGEQTIDLALKLFSSIVANGINISQPGQDSDRALEEASVLKGIASKPNSTKTVKNLELYVLTLLTTITHPSGSSASLSWFTSDVSTDVRSKYYILISPIYERFRPPSMTVFSICKNAYMHYLMRPFRLLNLYHKSTRTYSHILDTIYSYSFPACGLYLHQ